MKRKTSYWIKAAVALAFIFQFGPALAAASVEQLRGSGARVVTDARTGVARFVGFDAQAVGQQPAEAALRQLPTEAAAAQHLSSHAELFGLRNAVSETRTVKHRVDKDGRAMTRYQQQHQGLPVIAGELIVNQTAHGQLTSISGKISPQLTLDTTPVITAQEAKAIARQAMAKWYQLSADEFVVPEPTLSIYDSRLMSPHSDPVVLVWRLNVTTKSLRPINEFMAVNAKTGGIALHFNQVPHSKNRLTYDAANTTVLPGTLVCAETNPTCAGGIEDAVDAHRYAGTSYDFYATNFGRDGIDGAGMPMKSTVRHCEMGEACPYPNAFWNGIQMVYGQGFAKAEDIVAHELTHGVTDYESQLFYYYQSGAINESLSDVFGEFTQQSNLSGTVTRKTKWLIGEDLSIGALRSMSDPPDYRDPDRMTSPNYYTAAGDDGGVHINSGVNNKAAYLMVDGETFNGRTVTGIGLTKAAKIYYRVQTALLTSGSDYSDLHSALFQACQDLIGTADIGAADCLSVQNATLAVEMNLAPNAGFNPEATICPAGQSVSGSIFSDNLESGGRNWSFTHSLGTQDWSRMIGYASSGNYSLYGVDLDVISDLSASLARGVTLPANAHLWFKHAFDFEASSGSYYDGGVLEYSSNGGITWNDAGSLYAQGQNYRGVLASGGNNPLQDRSAFVAESHGYVSSRYNLSALAGQTVRFRWRIGSDVFVGARGWYVDDVSVHVCAADAATVPAAPTIGTATASDAQASVAFTPGAIGSGTLSHYTAACSSDGTNYISAAGVSSPLTVANLSNGISYQCRVKTTSSVGDSPWSAQSNFVTPITPPGTLITRYRLYSDGTKEHLYTTDLNEYNVLPVCCGWLAEGAIYRIFQGAGSLSGVAAVPYYRLYNPLSYQHHWTTDFNEYTVLATMGWTQEGVDGYILPTSVAGTLPLYRLYLNAFGGLHLWTTDANERNVLTTTAGWVDEGVAGYVIPLQ